MKKYIMKNLGIRWINMDENRPHRPTEKEIWEEMRQSNWWQTPEGVKEAMEDKKNGKTREVR